MSKPQYYQLNEILIISPRFAEEEGQSGVIDVSNLLVELNIYESIFLPYITATLTILLSSEIDELSDLIGQEAVVISIKVGDEDTKRSFIISSIGLQEKTQSGQASVITFNLVERMTATAAFIRLNASYSGQIDEIISEIYSSQLFNETKNDFISDSDKFNPANFEQAKQTVKVTGNNRNPIQFCNWLKNNATSDLGEPFFLYSTIKEGPKFRHLGSLFQEENIDEKESVYFYSSVRGNPADSPLERYRINSLKIKETDNVLSIASHGGFNTTFVSIDPFKKNFVEGSFDQQEYFEQKKSVGNVPEELNLNDTRFKFTIDGEEKSVNEIPSVIYSRINTTNAFEDGFQSYDERATIEEHMDKVRRKSDLLFLNKQKFEIIIPGYTMLSKSYVTSVGKVINIMIPDNKTHFKNDDSMTDRKRSPKGFSPFLITKVRHKFNSDNIYVCALSVAKISNSEK